MPCAASKLASKPGHPRFFRAAEELSHRCGLLWRAFPGFHHHQLVFTDTVPAPKRRGLLVFARVEALDALFERRKLDHDEAVEFLGTFEDPVAPAAREHLGAVLREDRRHAVGVLLVLDRIVDFSAGYPVGGHDFSFIYESRSRISRGLETTASASQVRGSTP